jgi:hypothetical protein
MAHGGFHGGDRFAPAPALNYGRSGGSRAGGRARKKFVKGGGLETGGQKIRFPISGGGGYFGGGADAGQYGQQDIDAQIGISEDIWKKTTPGLKYTGGSNKWTQNPDGTWALTSELDEMEQGIYDQSGMLTSTLGDQAQEFFGGGYEGMYQNRLDRLRNQYTQGDAREEAIRRARQLATGASSTGIYSEDANRASFIDQRDLGLINKADEDIARHGEFLMGNRERSLGMLTKTGDIGNQFLATQMSYADPTTNYQNLSDAYTGKFDQMAAADTEKRKGKSKFWNSIFQVGGAALGVPPAISQAAAGLLYS